VTSGAQIVALQQEKWWTGGELYVFCPSCGERYFTAGTLREIERIRALKTTRIRRRSIPIVSFGAA
jgi:hypothetical protein